MICKIFQVQTAKNNGLTFEAACSVTAPLALAALATRPAALAVGPLALVAQPPNRGGVSLHIFLKYRKYFQ